MRTKVIDPRTTRRRIGYLAYQHNSALYSLYEVVGYVGVKGETPVEVILQKKAVEQKVAA